jgi:hypothetical protein
MRKSLFVLGIALVFMGCTKSPGEGGKATIIGNVEAIYVEKGSFDTLGVGPLPESRVYIIYGNGNLQDDDARTSTNGGYKFEYLNPGDYTLYTYSESLINNSGLQEESIKVTIGKKDTEVTVPKITVIEYK